MVRIFGHLVQRIGWSPPFVAQLVVTGIGDDAQDPALERPAAESLNTFKGGQECFLAGVGSRVSIAHDAIGDVVSHALISHHQSVKGG